MKRRAWATGTLTLLLLITGCKGTGPAETGTSAAEPVNLVYYTIGNPDEDLSLVNDAVNAMLAEKIGVTLTMHKITWQDYEKTLNTLVMSESSFDIAFAIEYASYAQRGAFLPLDEYLEREGAGMYEAVNPLLWEGVRMMDGRIYGVPTNKELSVQEHWMYPKELVDKYRIDITRYRTLESLEPLLAMIKDKEPDYLPMELEKNTSNFFTMYGYEHIVSQKLPFVVKPFSPEPQVLNAFETPEARQMLETLRAYYTAGYINEDAALKQVEALEPGKKVFLKSAGGGILSENSWSRDRGYAIVSCAVTPPIVTTEHTRGGVMSVSASTKYPVECVKFLNLLNTDPEVRNLFHYGIEGIHYELDENGQVVLTHSERYAGVQYTQGNWFILHTIRGEPANKWDLYEQTNAGTIKSPLLGFTPDLSAYAREMAAITIACEKYGPCLLTGSVDVETELARFLQELKQAGMDGVIAELQRQLDEWRLS